MEGPAFGRPEVRKEREPRELARAAFGIAEDVGDLIDVRIRSLAAEGRLTPFEISSAADDARRAVFSRVCDEMGISEATRTEILEAGE